MEKMSTASSKRPLGLIESAEVLRCTVQHLIDELTDLYVKISPLMPINTPDMTERDATSYCGVSQVAESVAISINELQGAINKLAHTREYIDVNMSDLEVKGQ